MTRSWISLAVVAALALASCGSDAEELVARGDPVGELAPPPPADTPPMLLWLSATRVPPGPVELVAVLVNHTGEEATFGVGAAVDRWDGEAWVPHRVVGMCLDHWHCTAEMRGVGDELETPAIGLSASIGRPGPPERFSTDGLDEGWYRVSQTANGGTMASGVVEVAEGAAPPAPLVATDAPAISVDPAVVAPAGSVVSLYPLIPAPSGSQSAGDIAVAVEGLAEAADIERWNGERWEKVGETPLVAPDPSSFDHQRSAALPALEAGEYRLVRSGPGGDHVGHFWVASLDREPSEPVGGTVEAPTTSIDERPDDSTVGGEVGALGDLDLRLELDDATLSPGAETQGYLVVENNTDVTVVDPGCVLANVELGVVPADKPDASLAGRVMTDCGGAFPMPPGFTERWPTATFAARDAQGDPLEPGEYLAVVRHGDGIDPLFARLTITAAP